MNELDQFRDQLLLAIAQNYSNMTNNHNMFARCVYDVAESIAAERAKRNSTISVPFSTQPEGDLFKPRLVFIGSDGRVTAETDSAVAVVLPQYRRMFVLGVESANNWDHANEVVAKCNVLAFADWYLPSVKELELLVCRDRISPATYPALIKHTPFDDWYWSRDLRPSGSFFAFGVDLSDGDVHWGYRSGSGLVRACRVVTENELIGFGL